MNFFFGRHSEFFFPFFLLPFKHQPASSTSKQSVVVKGFSAPWPRPTTAATTQTSWSWSSKSFKLSPPWPVCPSKQHQQTTTNEQTNAIMSQYHKRARKSPFFIFSAGNFMILVLHGHGRGWVTHLVTRWGCRQVLEEVQPIQKRLPFFHISTLNLMWAFFITAHCHVQCWDKTSLCHHKLSEITKKLSLSSSLRLVYVTDGWWFS